jgi:hypothetical protein
MEGYLKHQKPSDRNYCNINSTCHELQSNTCCRPGLSASYRSQLCFPVGGLVIYAPHVSSEPRYNYLNTRVNLLLSDIPERHQASPNHVYRRYRQENRPSSAFINRTVCTAAPHLPLDPQSPSTRRHGFHSPHADCTKHCSILSATL